MKRFICCLIAALIFLLPAAGLHAQASETDAIYLNNGSKIKGTIIELVRDRTVKIRVAEGSTYVFQISDVKNIEMNPQSAVQIKEQPDEMPAAQPQQPNAAATLFQLNAFAGLSLPAGKFASTTDADGGAAETGFLIGARYLGGKPQYEPTITYGIYSATGPKYSQSTGCFLITAGIAL